MTKIRKWTKGQTAIYNTSFSCGNRSGHQNTELWTLSHMIGKMFDSATRKHTQSEMNPSTSNRGKDELNNSFYAKIVTNITTQN